MKSKQKALVLLMCAAFIAVASVFGTFAYLTDTESIANTFTVGRVGLTLNEAKVNHMGERVNAQGNVLGENEAEVRVQPTSAAPQQYHLLPGHTYTKDPTVTVDKDSEAAYVRMMVTIKYKDAAESTFTTYPVDKWLNLNGTNWDIIDVFPETVEKDGFTSRTYEFRYLGNDTENPGNGIVLKNAAATKLEPLFTKLSVPGAVTNTELAALADMEITVVAHAIQASGFTANSETGKTAEDAAWDAFDAQYNPPSKS